MKCKHNQSTKHGRVCRSSNELAGALGPYAIILCIMLCCGCLFIELIDRREGVLAERRARTVKEGKERWIEAGSLERAVTCFLVD